MLQGKKILLGITASIAAYKAAFLVRLLIKEGAEVKVIMTPSAIEFITPLTLATLSKNPVHSDFTEDLNAGVWNNHVELGLWADLMLIAPCTANTLAKMTSGICDTFLQAVYLSARCPVFFAPAMDLDMFTHESTQENIQKLINNNNILIEPESGELASGLEGKGRMAEPENIVSFLKQHLLKNSPLARKKILITAGPTYEAIDPVRFIGNHSSGKMGFAIAEECAKQGAQVTLITGPTALSAYHSNITRFSVVSAQEMYDVATSKFQEMDAAVLAAAVADYRPKNVAQEKIKKKGESLTLELEKTQDILFALGQNKKHQKLIGFALETQNELENAQGKLTRKNLDMIVLNSLRDKGAGFGVNTNKITILKPNNKMINFELKSKREVAQDIVKEIIDLFK